MPQGQPATVPEDGLTTRQRRNRPLVVVHTGEMKGKSTAAFGLALRGWSQGWSIGVFQFVKSAKWRVGEEQAFRALGRVHAETGEGGPVEWHKMGQGWSWSRKRGLEDDHAVQAQEGWAEIRRRLEAGCTTSTCSTSSPTRSSGAGSTCTRWSTCWPAARAGNT